MLVGLNMSKIMLAVILIGTFTAGAFLSYLWVVGYYVSLELNVPERPVISIQDFVVSAEDPTFFNVTILNPSFSPRETEIVGMRVLTGDGILHQVSSVSPKIPSGGYMLEVGSMEIFKCLWTWTNYTGQEITLIVLVKDGSGGTFTVKLPLVNIELVDVTLDPERGDSLNLTVRNSENSTSGFDLERIEINVDDEKFSMRTEPNLPIRLEPASSINLSCKWNWTEYQGKTATIVARTVQGYSAKRAYEIPIYAILDIRNIEFNLTDTTHFNITVVNSEDSLITLNVTSITMRLENGSILAPTIVTPPIPYILDKNATVTFVCELDWSGLHGEDIKITVSTEQGYKIEVAHKIP